MVRARTELLDSGAGSSHTLIWHKVSLKLFRKSQFPHKSVKLFFISVIVKDKCTNLCGN